MGPHWKGTSSLQNMIIMGDSYSKYEGKTWPCVHNFAFPGATAEDDLTTQIESFFAIYPKKSTPKDEPPLDPTKSTYFVFIGINDCGRTAADDLETPLETIFDALDDLYIKAGARNFLLVDVPPMHRSPQAAASDNEGELAERVQTWNERLRERAQDFASSSSQAMLSEVLDDPCEFDLTEDDPETEDGGFWLDDLHITASVHAILSDKLLDCILHLV
ncbi:uncharacterized protein BXZ73DRAFT_92316 [Epithele typhae]|uniref:uncharacterized protein n=1 Tax=Epithele typhae TaxID=378194 RepID=UPI0020073DD2|nr:uncharacterized protein BXZ73DRAFT_92316 [Epithele typhae]KAH9917892.1 hypothetical protein BXZ73DRAFT_92316 [Epithele typhae]